MTATRPKPLTIDGKQSNRNAPSCRRTLVVGLAVVSLCHGCDSDRPGSRGRSNGPGVTPIAWNGERVEKVLIEWGAARRRFRRSTSNPRPSSGIVADDKTIRTLLLREFREEEVKALAEGTPTPSRVLEDVPGTKAREVNYDALAAVLDASAGLTRYEAGRN